MIINRPKVPDEPPGEIPPPLNPLQVKVEAIRAKTMACTWCDDEGKAIRKWTECEVGDPCTICGDERALLDIVDELMEALEEND